jgi:hypothetical protein
MTFSKVFLRQFSQFIVFKVITMTCKTSESFLRHAQKKYNAAKVVINTFKLSLDENPTHVLTWADSAFAAGAEVQVYGDIIASLKDHKVPLRDVSEGLRDSMIYGASCVSNHSTSTSKNYMNECILAVSAAAYRDMLTYIEAQKD